MSRLGKSPADLKVRGLTPLLEVFDMAVSLGFYRDVLGFDVVEASGPVEHCSWARLVLRGAALMLNTAYEDGDRPSAPDPERIAAHADTVLFFACADLDAAYTSLRSLGVDVTPPVTREYGMRQIWLADPDGFKLCFQWPAG